MLEQIRADTFREYIDSDFEILDNPTNIFSIKLRKIIETVNTEKGQTFSLFFAGALERFLPQKMYTLKHANAGEFKIFLVPIARHQDRFEYEAVFNLIF